jgi:hypothetical protein
MHGEEAAKSGPWPALDPADQAGGSHRSHRRGGGKIFGHLVNRSSHFPL